VCFISQCNKDCASVLQRELLESNVPDTTESMDLISSLPHQTLVMCEESLRLAIESQPGHVSVYDLQVEQGTKFWKRVPKFAFIF